ncbi:MAG: HAMP domain-containing protein, partial [Acidimicrobiaceae bacterium]|nr:HAMP domain-containing protein [Acidimicrobiaceae bacterium]
MAELMGAQADRNIKERFFVRYRRRVLAGRVLGTAGRLVALYGVVTSVVLGLSVYQVVNNFSQHYMGLARSDLGGEVPEFSTAASVRTQGQSLFSFSEYYLRSHGSLSQHRIVIALANQTTLASTGASWLVSVPIVSSMLKHPPARTIFYTTSYGARGPILILGSPIMQNSKPVGLLVAESSLASLYSQKRQVALLSGFEALVALVFSILSSYYLLRRVMKAVGAITEAAVEIYQGDLDTRLVDAGEKDEVGGLVAAFNQMIAKISDTLKAQQRLLADVSHQLRTPLT